MKRITARYDGQCAGCSGTIHAGNTILWSKARGAWHPSCYPTGVDPAADREYLEGAAQASRWQSDKAIYGEDLANEWELERELREGWD